MSHAARSSAMVVFAIAGFATTLNAQVIRSFTGGFGGPWHSAGSWTGGAIPGPLDTALINAFSPTPALCRINSPGLIATAMQVRVGTGGRGWIDHTTGGLIVGDQLILGETGSGGGSLGEYSISSDAALVAHEIICGQEGGGLFTVSGDSTVTTDHLIVANGGASFYEKRLTQSDGSNVTVNGALEVGVAGPGTYRLRGGTNEVHRLLVGGPGSTGTGVYTLDALPGGARILKIRDDGQIGRGAGALAGTLNNNGGTIEGTLPTAEVFVNGSSGRLLGTGTYNIKVTFHDAVDVRFARDSLRTSAVLTVAPGLIGGNAGWGAGSAEMVTTLSGRMLAGSMHNLSWSTTTHATGVDYDIGPGTPGIEVPCDPTTATTAGDIPVANIASRVRLMQFGQNIHTDNRHFSLYTAAGEKFGEIRNISTPGGVHADRVVGASENVGGNYDVAVLGHAVEPIHQNPSIAELHGAGYGLTGSGVVMGQIEPGEPDVGFGCFEDWSMAAGVRASVLPGALGVDPHTTFVASLMVGFDPLGIQVNGDSQFEVPANRYGRPGAEGFGFTGVAPKATLISMDDRIAEATPGDNFRALAARPGMKVINMSTGIPIPPGPPANGGSAEELAIDREIELRDLIFVKSAGNEGPGGTTITTPGGVYNGIVVGNAEFDGVAPASDYPRHFDVGHAGIRPSSSRGPTLDGRAKPDLVAQGVGGLGAFMMEEWNAVPPGSATGTQIDTAYPVNTNHGLYSVRGRVQPGSSVPNSGTSFAAPQVAGVAALMVQHARLMGDVAAEDPRVIKSLLQTAADKPATWSRATAGPGDDGPTNPLSYDWGAGLLDPVGSIELMDAGRYTHDAGPIATDGWNLTTVSDTDPLTAFGFSGHSYFLDDVLIGSSLTATLNWYRHVDAAGAPLVLTDLDFQIYTWDGVTPTLLALQSSTNAIDNVEHIYIPTIPATSDYILRVFAFSFDPRPAEQYAVSWDFTTVPAPGAVLVLLMGGTIVLRRRSR